MKLNYVTKPLDKWVTSLKTESMVRARTLYECPLCHQSVKKRSFEEHVYSQHKFRVDEAFALFYGVSFPAKCTCGRDLHYDRTHRGFRLTCGLCTSQDTAEVGECKTSADAHSKIAKLKQLLSAAIEQEKKLREAEKLESTPLESLPFPSMKYKAFLSRLALSIRVGVVNGDKQALFDLANFITNRISGQQ